MNSEIDEHNPFVLRKPQGQIVLPDPERLKQNPGHEIIWAKTPRVDPYQGIENQHAMRFDKDQIAQLEVEVAKLKLQNAAKKSLDSREPHQFNSPNHPQAESPIFNEPRPSQDDLPKLSLVKQAQNKIGGFFRRRQEQSAEKKLTRATTLAELLKMTATMKGEVQGSMKAYSGPELAGLIRDVQSGRQPIESITKAGGLRNIVIELLKQEQQR